MLSQAQEALLGALEARCSSILAGAHASEMRAPSLPFAVTPGSLWLPPELCSWVGWSSGDCVVRLQLGLAVAGAVWTTWVGRAEENRSQVGVYL